LQTFHSNGETTWFELKILKEGVKQYTIPCRMVTFALSSIWLSGRGSISVLENKYSSANKGAQKVPMAISTVSEYLVTKDNKNIVNKQSQS
jgi:hypothetical protein